ncbi:protein kinase domain-containing protein [Actinophytocola sp.]|uniref:protein kinase domain-containing protein n=1 Tax=Actinophytocola sp. TaxID=1872138 RepID=UPI002ED9F109
MGSRLGGGYELLHPVWRDNLGTTFIARAPSGWPVSVRVLPATLESDPTVRHRFRQDLALLCAVRHPNLVAVHDLLTDDGLAIVSDAVDGVSLHRVRATGPLAPPELARVGEAIGAGLSALHAAGLQHQHLTPRNVHQDRAGRIHLADIALAQLLADSPAGRRLLRADAAAYPPADPATADEHALGVLLRELGGAPRQRRRAQWRTRSAARLA